MRTFSLLALMTGVLVFAGCADSVTDSATETAAKPEAAAEATVTLANEICPIMGKPVKDGGGTAEWNGKTVGFCCPGCIKKWEALSEDEKAVKLADDKKTASTGSCCSEATTTCCSKEGAAKTCCKDAESMVATTGYVCPMKCAPAAAEAGKCRVCRMELVQVSAGGQNAPCCSATASGNEAVTSINKNCPIMGQPVKAGGGSAEWKGKTVAFCCPGCVKKWDALSDDAKAAKLTAANPADAKPGA